jgi:hypothetical protein
VAGVGGLPITKSWAWPGQEENPRQFVAYSVSFNYFSLLGAVPHQGRWFSPEEELHGAEPVVVLSHKAWKHIGGQPEHVGAGSVERKTLQNHRRRREGFGASHWLTFGCLWGWSSAGEAWFAPNLIPKSFLWPTETRHRVDIRAVRVAGPGSGVKGELPHLVGEAGQSLFPPGV